MKLKVCGLTKEDHVRYCFQNKVEFFRIENILQNYIDVKTKDKYELSKDFKLRRTLILSKKIMELSWYLLKEYLGYSYNFTFNSSL